MPSRSFEVRATRARRIRRMYPIEPSAHMTNSLRGIDGLLTKRRGEFSGAFGSSLPPSEKERSAPANWLVYFS
jgi:hypothetical protein